MTTGEGADPRGGAREDRQDQERRPDRIGLGGGDESVTRIQLAARWAESYGPHNDSLASILKRFRAAYEYLDAVTHSVEPPDLDRELHDARPMAPPTGRWGRTPARELRGLRRARATATSPRAAARAAALGLNHVPLF